MTTKTSLETIRHVPDELWNVIAPVLGPEKEPGTPGRPAVPFARSLTASSMFYAPAVSGPPCRDLNSPQSQLPEGASNNGVRPEFQQAWALVLKYYDLEAGIAWKWQSLDGVITKAPLGGEATSPSPADRAKSGTKRSVLSDGPVAPLSISVRGANAHDKTLALETRDSIPVRRPPRRVYRLHHLCLNAGYDFEDVICGVQERDYRLHLKKRGAEPIEVSAEKKHPARRSRS